MMPMSGQMGRRPRLSGAGSPDLRAQIAQMALMRAHPEPDPDQMGGPSDGDMDNMGQRRMSIASMRRRPLAID